MLVLLSLITLQGAVPDLLLAQASSVPTPPAITARFDNDVLARTDRGYTGGLRVRWDSEGYVDLESNPWISWIPLGFGSENTASLAISLGQKVYTPDSIQWSRLAENDRPYAGVLYLTLGVPVRSQRHHQLLELTLGLVGPSAQAERAQAIIHKLAPHNEPQGWANQLKDEPLLAVNYEHKWKAFSNRQPEEWAFEFIPYYAAGLGNLHTFGAVGGQVRVGWNMSDDFGVETLRPSGFRGSSPKGEEGLGFEMFAAVDRKAILHDLLLDGNTFRQSHSVKKEPFTSSFIIGGTVSFWRFCLGYEHILWTKQFATEAQNQEFSSFSLHFTY